MHPKTGASLAAKFSATWDYYAEVVPLRMIFISSFFESLLLKSYGSKACVYCLPVPLHGLGLDKGLYALIDNYARGRVSLHFMLFTVRRNYEKLRLVAKKRWFYGNHYARVSIRFCRSFCFLRLYEIIKNWRSSRAGAYWSDNHIFDHDMTRKKSRRSDHFLGLKSHSMQPQGVEQKPESIGNYRF